MLVGVTSILDGCVVVNYTQSICLVMLHCQWKYFFTHAYLIILLFLQVTPPKTLYHTLSLTSLLFIILTSQPPKPRKLFYICIEAITEVQSAFTVKASQTLAVFRLHDFGVCNTQYILYFVFSTLKWHVYSGMLWPLIAWPVGYICRFLFCNFLGTHIAVVLLNYFTWELLSKNRNLNGNMLFFAFM
jgi:hypothetical protein